MGEKHELRALRGRIMIVEKDEPEFYDESENFCLLCPPRQLSHLHGLPLRGDTLQQPGMRLF
jgi:hypothetical protein